MAEADFDVLVVGMGPVGAMLGALLARAGVKTLVIDKDTEVYPLPRAAHFDHEIMRLFQQIGIADEVRPHARPAPAYEFRTADGQILMSFDLSGENPSGWATGYMFHQPGVENALRARLQAAERADVRLGCRLDGLAQDENGVTATLTSSQGTVNVRSRYVVGCDGAASQTRRQVGIELDDYQFDEPWLVIDAKTSQGSTLPKVSLQICDPARPVTCVPMGPGRHRWEFMLLPGETPEAVLSDDFILPRIAQWNCGEITLERRAVYRFHGLVAQRWRVGRVLLAGDAAHQMPPFAGQGMCSGMRDAANLAWKLKAVLRDGADEALLDTYQAEREAHVRGIVNFAIGMGRVICTLDADAAAMRDQTMLAQRAAGGPGLPAPSTRLSGGCLMAGQDVSGVIFPQPWIGAAPDGVGLDDLLGDGPWLISRSTPGAAEAGLLAISTTDPFLAAVRRPLEAWLDAQGADAVLVRPDRYVFGVGAPTVLREAWLRALSASSRSPVSEPAR
ncbi:bifunctional 3-(3-hydroxy-phenyl)propionate/3-hydroxycinnamic acid hydroxylase [Caulobacter soli]|uniref:bifunctional 3-(3-hydroxy-phenyl)propionate/3-hydroxycinnamic acid hydroxylase MhpA n=1 Tax=Caulobacter soli TaxID=2708539 RepID=UPI0013ED4515|nr:bifunctional 3-(3-hydroxy-phenyl)propionate/3-hydroxycinnamic acid hydroxylase [Caulobacter soli]